MYSSGELFMSSREGYFGVYFPSCAATREINTKITLEWAHKQFVTRVHTLFYFLHDITYPKMTLKTRIFTHHRGWVGLWGFLWWVPSAKRKDHHGVSSGWSSVWHRSNTGLSSTQFEQIPIILGVWPFWLTPFFLWSITFWRAYG